MSFTTDKDEKKNQDEFNLDDYPDVADWSQLKKKDLIDLLENDVFGLYGLMSVCDVVILEDDPDIKTACLTLTASPKIYFNRKFLQKFCHTKNHIFMVLMHELYHKILNHAALFKTTKKEDQGLLNIATDAFINSLLYQLYSDEKYATFFRDFYNILISEKQSKDPSFKGHPLHMLKNRSEKQIADFRTRTFYGQLYSPFGQDIDSLIAFMRDTVPKQYVQYASEHGIGDHSGQTGEIHEHLRKEITKIAKAAQKTLTDQAEEYHEMLEARKRAEEEAKKRKEEKEGKGKDGKDKKDGKAEGKGNKSHAGDFDPDERKKAQAFNPESSAFCRYVGGIIEYLEKKDKELQSAMIKMAKQSVESKVIIKTKSMFPAIPAYTVRPNFKDKGGLVAHHMGRYKPFYKNPLLPKDFGLVHVYIDVSGSMGHYVDNIYTVLSSRALHDLLWPQIHLFSTHIEDITKKQLREKVIDTSFGTDFSLIFEHMGKNQVKKALIFTDGYGEISKNAQDIIKKNKIRCITVFTPDRSPSNPFIDVSEETYTFTRDMKVKEDNWEEEKKSNKRNRDW